MIGIPQNNPNAIMDSTEYARQHAAILAEIAGQNEHQPDEYYCGLCGTYVSLASGLHPHGRTPALAVSSDELAQLSSFYSGIDL